MQHTKLKQVKQLECVIIQLEANYDTIKQYIFHWESRYNLKPWSYWMCSNITLQNPQKFTTTTANTAASTKLR